MQLPRDCVTGGRLDGGYEQQRRCEVGTHCCLDAAVTPPVVERSRRAKALSPSGSMTCATGRPCCTWLSVSTRSTQRTTLSPMAMGKRTRHAKQGSMWVATID